MSKTSGDWSIRVATLGELPRLVEIELESDSIFAEVGIGPFQYDCSAAQLAAAAIVLVAGKAPVGFVSVEVVDDAAHIWQLSVLPSMQRQGIGRALVAAVCDWAAAEGYIAVTLTTFRDVPWNAPFYEKLGFVELRELTPSLVDIRRREREVGDDALGARIAMRLELCRRGNAAADPRPARRGDTPA